MKILFQVSGYLKKDTTSREREQIVLIIVIKIDYDKEVTLKTKEKMLLPNKNVSCENNKRKLSRKALN